MRRIPANSDMVNLKALKGNTKKPGRSKAAAAGKSGRRVVSALITTAFAQEDADAAKAQWRRGNSSRVYRSR